MKQDVRGCCPLDCQDSCSWIAHVEDGQVAGISGEKNHPITRGVLCAKVRDYEKRITAPDRLLYPLKRVGAKGEGRFERIAWDAALAEIAERFRDIIAAHGAEALMPFQYLGAMGVVQRYAPLRVFHALGASRTHGGVCAASASALLAEGHPIGVDPEEAPEAELVILWGQNVLSTCHHQWHFINEARRRKGARIIAIDPRVTRTTQQCDRHLVIKPGSDAVLAAALGRILLEEGHADLGDTRKWAADIDAYRNAVLPWTLERAAAATGLAESEIHQLAEDFAKARPALIRAGVAPQQTVHGDAFVRGLSALAILGGHWRHKGGGLSILSMAALDEVRAGRPDLVAGSPRSLDVAKLANHLSDKTLSPPIKGLMVWSANPAITQIDGALMQHGLRREDLFLVVHDHFLTDTARMADIVLPATTQFEHFDLQGAWGHHYVSVNHPAIAPAAEARSGGALMRGLAHALGLNHPALQESDEEIAASCLPADWSFEELKTAGWRKLSPPQPAPESLAAPLYFFRERIEAPREPPPGALQLLTPKSHYFLNSTFANMPRHRQSLGPPTIAIGAAEADSRGLSEGDPVTISNGASELHARLKVAQAMANGVAFLEGKWWAHPDEAAAPANLLSRGNWSAKGQPAYNETYVTLSARN